MTDEEIEYGIETACNCANSNPSPCWTVNPYPIIRDYIQRLKAENASLRERLDKAVILPCKVGDKFYRIDYYPPEITEKECCGFSFIEFPKIFLVDGCGCTYELGDNGSSFITLNKSEAEQIYNKKLEEQHND